MASIGLNELMALVKGAHTLKQRPNLNKLDLSGANLSLLNLFGADLVDANLSEADLSGTNLSFANCQGANLSEAILVRANLSGADLSDAYMGGADFFRADLIWTDLSGADLSDANLNQANLRAAKYNSKTLWPPDFDLDLAGAVRVD